MGMPMVAGFKGDVLRLQPHDVFENSGKLNIAVMRPGVIAPADMGPALLLPDIFQRFVENSDVGFNQGEKLVVVEMFVARVPPHGQVRAVDLQGDAVRGNNFIFFLQGDAQLLQVGFIIRIVLVFQKQGDGSR